MSNMIQDMLDIARLKHTDRSELEYISVACSMSDLVTNFRIVHPTFDIELENKLISPGKALIHKNHYDQAMTILLDNAVKYSGKIGNYIKVTLSEDDDMIITKVLDHGLGICKEDQAYIFERFFRADKARNREIGGTGLGLAIIKNIAQIYKGSISVESQVGKGAVFTFKIPKNKEKI